MQGNLHVRFLGNGAMVTSPCYPVQQAVIDYLIEENRVLKEQLEGQRLRFTDEQRIRLAVKAKVLGRRFLDETERLVTPGTMQSHSGI